MLAYTVLRISRQTVGENRVGSFTLYLSLHILNEQGANIRMSKPGCSNWKEVFFIVKLQSIGLAHLSPSLFSALLLSCFGEAQSKSAVHILEILSTHGTHYLMTTPSFYYHQDFVVRDVSKWQHGLALCKAKIKWWIGAETSIRNNNSKSGLEYLISWRSPKFESSAYNSTDGIQSRSWIIFTRFY